VPHGFGEWAFIVGDELAVGHDVRGNLHAIPRVEDFLVEPPLNAGLGARVSLGKTDAVVASAEAAQSIERAAASSNGAIRVATILNRRTGERRIWLASGRGFRTAD
jgi:hypothetical protein